MTVQPPRTQKKQFNNIGKGLYFLFDEDKNAVHIYPTDHHNLNGSVEYIGYLSRDEYSILLQYI